MSELFNACNTSNVVTENGAVAHGSTLSECLNLFAAVGASRGKDLTPLFIRAFSEDKETAIRVMLFSRDIRGGMGERQHFKTFIGWLVKGHPILTTRVLKLIPEVGRWDDLKSLEGTAAQDYAVRLWGREVTAGNALACKWLPRKGVWFNRVRKYLRIDPKTLRKHIVKCSQTVEQLMSARDWKSIEFGKVPSMASFRYRKAFARHMPKKYEEWVEGLANGTAKVNSSTMYPHEIVSACDDDEAADARWKGLPDYLEGSSASILPMIDVSGSMHTGVGGSSSLSAITVATALGIYLAERSKGVFKDEFMTFSERPKIQKLATGATLKDKVYAMSDADWGRTTNLTAAFELILMKARAHQLTQEQLPSTLLILSDMEFDVATTSSPHLFRDIVAIPETNFELIDRLFKEAGYKRPNIVFWNLAHRNEHFPVKFDDKGTALVSGFSPALMRAVLSDKMEEFTPLNVMLEAIGIDRYAF